MYSNILEELGLAKNEARIYETLVREGELGVGGIATKSEVHRRNVYDSLNRLIEKGLVFQIVASLEHRYRATDPKKLLELVKEKEEKVLGILPTLEQLHAAVPRTQDTFVYRGIEGWKNYMRDIARVGEDLYTIGGKGAWQDERLAHLLTQTARDMKEKEIMVHILFDPDVKGIHEVFKAKGFNMQYRYLPEGTATEGMIDVFGDHIVLMGDVAHGHVATDSSFTTLINPQLATAFRTWFRLIWNLLPEGANETTKRTPKMRRIA